MKIEFLFKDELNLRKTGDDYPVGVPNCCKVEDEETGIIVISTKGRSRADNKLRALELVKLWKSNVDEDSIT